MDEPQVPAPPQQSPPAQPLVRRLLAAPATCVITFINIAVFIAAEIVGSTYDFRTLIQFGASERSLIWSGEYWRFVTPMFLHIGIAHLAVNTWVLFRLCSVVERVVGRRRFVFLYLFSGIGGTAASVLCHDAISAGASGAGFGIIGVVFVLSYRKLGSWDAFISNPGIRQNMVLIVIWTVLGFTVIRMDNYAHLGGLAVGCAYSLLFTMNPLRYGVLRRLAWACFVVVLAGAVVAASIRWPGQKAWFLADSSYRSAIRLHEAGRYEEAIALYDDAESEGGGHWAIYYNRGLAESALGRLDDALGELNKACWAAPREEKGGVFSVRGEIRYRLGDLKGTVEDCTKAIEVDPKREKAYLYRALAKHAQEEFQDALKDYGRAVYLSNGRDVYALLGQARVLYDMEDYEGSAAVYSKVIELDPANADAYCGRGATRQAISDFSLALEDYSKAIELGYAGFEVYDNRGTTRLQLKDFHGAISDFSRVIEMKSDYAEAFEGRAFARSQLKEYDEAIGDFGEAIQIDPTRSYPRHARGAVWAAYGEYGKAVEDVTEAVRLGPATAEMYVDRGLWLCLDGKSEQSLEDFRKAEELDQHDPYLYGNWSLALARTGRNQEAVEKAEKALAVLTGESPYYAYAGRGLARLQMGNKSGALEDFEKYGELTSDGDPLDPLVEDWRRKAEAGE